MVLSLQANIASWQNDLNFDPPCFCFCDLSKCSGGRMADARLLTKNKNPEHNLLGILISRVTDT
jgi:hypothetical protein